MTLFYLYTLFVISVAVGLFGNMFLDFVLNLFKKNNNYSEPYDVFDDDDEPLGFNKLKVYHSKSLANDEEALAIQNNASHQNVEIEDFIIEQESEEPKKLTIAVPSNLLQLQGRKAWP